MAICSLQTTESTCAIGICVVPGTISDDHQTMRTRAGRWRRRLKGNEAETITDDSSSSGQKTLRTLEAAATEASVPQLIPNTTTGPIVIAYKFQGNILGLLNGHIKAFAFNDEIIIIPQKRNFLSHSWTLGVTNII